VAAALLLISLANAIPAFAADTFTPNPWNVTVAAGGSASVEKTLHLDALPGSADIIIAIDTTGSMSAAIAQAKAQASQLCTDVQTAIPGARFAVFDFKDIPDRPATNGVLILTPIFTSSYTAVQTAIDTMSASGGGDFAEAYNPTFRARTRTRSWTRAGTRPRFSSSWCSAMLRRTTRLRRPSRLPAATSRRPTRNDIGLGDRRPERE
jgi:hypothetical protein